MLHVHIAILTAVLLCIQTSNSQDNVDLCSDCAPDWCPPPRGCLAGLVKDSCNCCYVCARREGERCDHEDLHSEGLGRCGDNLECRVRNDLDREDPPEAVCFCLNSKPLCGNDGVTYENICQLTEARYRRRDGLRAVSSSPCFQTARVISPPQDVRNKTDSYAAMTCEAKGWPVPAIAWFLESDGVLVELPGNNTRIALQSRGGPEMDEATSWLLFLRLLKEDEGTYICNAKNDVGEESASAVVSLVD